MAEKMKDSGISWIGEVPESWETKKIKYMATLKGRIGWQGLTSDEYQDEGAFLITGVDFIDGSINWDSCVHIPMKRWEETTEIQIQNDDLLITKDGTVGKVALVSNLPGETSLNSGVLRIVPQNGYSRHFLYWVLQSDEFWNWFHFKNAGNSTIVHLYQGDFAEFIYTFPEENEQRAIASFLDRRCAQIDGIIADLEQQIDLLKRYKKSLITETVTKGLDKNAPMKDSGVEWIGEIPAHWEVKPLNHVATLRNGYVGPTQNLFVEDGIIYLQSLHIKDGEITFENYPPYFVPESWAALHPVIRNNDVLIVQTGDIGQIGLVTKEFDGCSCHALIIARPDQELLEGSFLRFYLMSDLGRAFLMMYQTGTTLLHLNSTKIKHSMIIVPPVEEQKEIAYFLKNKIHQIDDIVIWKNEQIDNMKNYKQSLIYEYVTGKKRVKEAHPCPSEQTS